MSRLIRRLFARPATRPASRQPRPVRRAADLRARLLVQGLEDRTVPAAFTVTTAADGGAGSLRDAITQANATTAADTINFSALFNSAQTISLLTALPTIVNPVTITGPGATLLTVRRDPSAGPFRVFTLDSVTPFSATLSGMTITGGQTTDTTPTTTAVRGGGGIRVGGTETVTIDGAIITGNRASGEGGGINVAVGGQLVVRNSAVTGNTAGTGPARFFSGGGIYFAAGGSLLLENSTISGNSSPTQGGGLYLYGSTTNAGNWTIRNSTISGNTAGVNGGAIMFYPASGNNGPASHSLTIQNSTIVNNTVTGAAGGNGGGGIAQIGALGTVTLTSSIVANNVAATGADLLTDPGAPVVATFSIVKDQTGANLTTDATDLPAGTDPMLGSLAGNGGPTQTHALQAGSPAVDHGANPFGLATDQRGPGNPRAVGQTDIGAFELLPPGTPTASGTFPDVSGGSTYQFSVTYTATAGGATIDGGPTNIGTGDILVTGPNGYSQQATLNSVTPGGSAGSQTATYTVTSPGAAWGPNDYGTYTIAVQASQVQDSQGHFVPAGAVGSFHVLTPATFTVTNTLDDGSTGSLRWAVGQANARTGTHDTINFGPLFATPQVIGLTGTQLTVSDPLTITGTSVANVTVSGSGASRIFNVSGPGVMDVTLANLTLTGGVATFSGLRGGGGAVFNDGENVTLANDVITANFATGDPTERGGAVFVGTNGTLTIQNSTLSGNSASGSGGAVYMGVSSSLTVQNSTLSGNTTAVRGGAAYFYANGSLSLVNSAVTGNRATSARGGGGVYFYGNVTAGGFTVQNTTISGNSAAGVGGGISLRNFTGNALIQDSTITGNTSASTSNSPVYGGGGGIAKTLGATTGTITLQGSIVAGNTSTATVNRPDIFANGTNTVIADHSLIGVVNSGVPLAPTSANNLTGTDAAPLNPLLGPLANNGGPTQTHLPQPGSPAVNHGVAVSGVTTDQAGNPRAVGVAPDIGAVETTDSGPVGTATLADVTAAGAATYTFTVTYADETAVQAASIGNANVQVTGPNGFSVLATAVPPLPTTNAPSLTVTYQFAAPAGAWSAAANGVYTVTRKAGQVSDGTNTSAADSILGTFQVRAPIVVTNTNDDANPGSLRWALGLANATFGTADTIVFNTNPAAGTDFRTPRTITLGGTALPVTDSVTVTGPGSGLLTVTGNAASQVLNVAGTGILNVTLSGLTVTGGNSATNGGGVFTSNENVTLQDVRVTNNSTTVQGGGIAVGTSGALTIRGSTISGNLAGGAAGGGVYVLSSGTLLLDSSTVSGNTVAGGTGGGGIYFFGTIGTSLTSGLVIRNSTISGNSALTNGAGIMLQNATYDNLVVQNSTIAFNSAGNSGGGIFRSDVTTGSTAGIVLQSSIVAQNQAALGSDVNSDGTVTAD
ncbi:MAG TPA: right-handed parallel beta-helix repeat-containing protein, partial [Gemmataceae bacterium]